MGNRRSPRQRKRDDEIGTKSTRDNAPTHTGWEGLTRESTPTQILEWITDRFGQKMLGLIKSKAGRSSDSLTVQAILNDALYRAVVRIKAGLAEPTGPLMDRPPAPLLSAVALGACIDWWRHEASELRKRRLKRDELLALRAAKRHNGRMLITPGHEGEGDTATDPTGKRLEQELSNMYETLGLSQNERDTCTAYTMLQCEYEKRGKKLPKKNLLPLLAEKFEANTGRPVSVEQIKGWRKTALNKAKDHRLRLARMLLSTPGGGDGNHQSIRRKRAGTRAPGGA